MAVLEGVLFSVSYEQVKESGVVAPVEIAVFVDVKNGHDLWEFNIARLDADDLSEKTLNLRDLRSIKCIEVAFNRVGESKVVESEDVTTK